MVAKIAAEGRTHERARAIRILGALGLPEYAGTIRSALEDPSPQVSLIAAQSLASPLYPEAIGPLLHRFDRFSDWHPTFLSGLLAGPGGAACPHLRFALRDRTRPDWARAIAAQALHNLRDLASADIAAAVLVEGGSPDLQVACLRLVAEFGETRHRHVLMPFLRSPEFSVRAHALKALQTAGDAADHRLFFDAMDDESPWVSLEGARGLRALGAWESLHLLARVGGHRSTLAREVLSP
jgi:HEAT repeat protein